jgi:hypothetical protein
LTGETSEDWQVVPVDALGHEGSGSVINWGTVDVAATVTVSGSPISSSQWAGGSILRLIDPSDIVDGAQAGERTLIKEQGHRIDVDSGVAYFMQLPRQRRLFLDIFYTPAVDLRTGAPTPTTVVTTIPFVLSGGSAQLDLEVSIELEQQPTGGGYYAFVDVSKGRGGQVEVSRTRIDYATGRVSRITDESHSFADEAELSDHDRDGVSEARYEQEILYGKFSPAWADRVTLEGTIGSFDEQAGVFLLTDVVQRAPAAGAISVDLTFKFSELTQFAEIVDAPEELISPIDPSALEVGDRLVTEALMFSASITGEASIWTQSAVRHLSAAP